MPAERERYFKIIASAMDRERETIHSGHFMASNVHELKPEDDEEIDVVSENGVEPPDPDVTPDTKDDKPVTFYKFGPQTTRSIAIDVSLTKLNKCIQIAYEKGKLTTPKWKSFKGLKLQWKDRIRLNNVIWRAWNVQFVQNNKPKYCFFSVPEEDFHGRSEASILEGMYWKRRLETVCAQYTRWRHYYFKQGKRRRSSVCNENRRSSESDTRMNLFDDEILFPTSGTPLTFDNDDDFTSWFTDTLFSSLNQPYMFPNPKQFAQSDNADLMQPGLIQLQPSLEEIMASLVSESSSGFLTSDNDPTLSMTENLDRFPSPDFGGYRRYRSGSASASTSASAASSSSAAASASSSGHYTSKDYADASLLVNYSKQATSSGGRTPVPSSAPRTPISCPSLLQPLPPDYDQEQSFSLPVYASPVTSTGQQLPYCEPYVPQVATIGAIRSGQMQYTEAHSWSQPVPLGNRSNSSSNNGAFMLEADFQQSAASPARRKKSVAKNRKSKSQQQQSVDRQNSVFTNSNESNNVVRTSNAPITESLLSSPPVTFTKPPVKKKEKSTKAFDSYNVPPKFQQQQYLPILKKQPKVSSSHRTNFDDKVVYTSKFVQPVLGVATSLRNDPISVNCDIQQTAHRQQQQASPAIVNASPVSQNSNVLRPIPIAFGRADQSAFSPLSPNNASCAFGAGVNSPIQRSPASTISANDFLRNVGGSTPTSASVVHVPAVSGTPFLSAVTQTAQNTTPVLILQSLTGMQIPIMALPYSNASTFPSTIPKQEPIEKTPVSLTFSSPTTTMVSNSSSGVKQEVQIIVETVKPHKSKSTKRAADSTVDPVERKRMQHLFAEQSRRSALKNGFELLEELLPDFHSNNAKATNAFVLLKSAERIRELKAITVNNEHSVSRLKSEIQQLNEKISNFQNRLPAPSPACSSNYLQQKYTGYVKQRCKTDNKFWMLYKIMEPLFETFKNEVQGANGNEIFVSAQEWISKHCSHAELRPAISQFLVSLATDSSILTDPASFSSYASGEASKL